jgi:hypothetical protein
VKPDEHCWEVSIELVGRNVEERYFYGIYLQTFRYKTVQITRLDNNFRRRRPETPSITVITLMAKLHGNCLRTSSLTENCCCRRNDTNPLFIQFSFKIPQPDGVVVRTLHKPFFK